MEKTITVKNTGGIENAVLIITNYILPIYNEKL